MFFFLKHGVHWLTLLHLCPFIRNSCIINPKMMTMMMMMFWWRVHGNARVSTYPQWPWSKSVCLRALTAAPDHSRWGSVVRCGCPLPSRCRPPAPVRCRSLASASPTECRSSPGVGRLATGRYGHDCPSCRRLWRPRTGPRRRRSAAPAVRRSGVLSSRSREIDQRWWATCKRRERPSRSSRVESS